MTPAPLLDDTEVELLQAFRKMSVHHQADLRDIAERWAQTDEGKPPDPSGEYDPRAPKQ